MCRKGGESWGKGSIGKQKKVAGKERTKEINKKTTGTVHVPPPVYLYV